MEVAAVVVGECFFVGFDPVGEAIGGVLWGGEVSDDFVDADGFVFAFDLDSG